MVELIRRDSNENHKTKVPITENQLGTMQLMEEVSEHVGMNYPDTPDSRCVAQPVGRRDLWRTQLPSKKARDSLSQDLQSANRQNNHRR